MLGAHPPGEVGGQTHPKSAGLAVDDDRLRGAAPGVGDVLGAAEQAFEIGFLLALAAVLA